VRIIEIPTWAKAFTLILLVQQSSAATERSVLCRKVLDQSLGSRNR